MLRKIGIFIAALLGAAGGLACVLQWLEIRPKDLWGGAMVVAIPHGLWLGSGLLLFVFSIGLSFYSLYHTEKRSGEVEAKIPSILVNGVPVAGPTKDQPGVADELARTKQEAVEQIARLPKQHESELYRSRQISDQLRGEIRAAKDRIAELEAKRPKPSQYPIPDLRLKILSAISELEGFTGQHGTGPQIQTILGGSTSKEQSEDYRQLVMPWRAKVAAQFRMTFGESLPKLRDEIAFKSGVSDDHLNNLIKTATNDPNPDVKIFHDMIDRLGVVALKIRV